MYEMYERSLRAARGFHVPKSADSPIAFLVGAIVFNSLLFTCLAMISAAIHWILSL
jgi:hypothetical protein